MPSRGTPKCHKRTHFSSNTVLVCVAMVFFLKILHVPRDCSVSVHTCLRNVMTLVFTAVDGDTLFCWEGYQRKVWKLTYHKTLSSYSPFLPGSTMGKCEPWHCQ